MKRLFQAFMLCAALLFCGLALADLVAIPKLERRVTDLTSTLSISEQSALEEKLKAFEAQKGSQIAVLILPSTQPEDIAQFGIRLAQTWQIGRDKQDDGVILIIAKDDRRMRIEVGYGLEGAIPDIYAKRIVSDYISPQFKQGHFYLGVDTGLQRIMELISGEKLPTPETPVDASSLIAYLPMLIIVVFVLGAIFKSIFGDFFGSLFSGGAVGGVVWLITALLGISALAALIAFIFVWAMGSPTGRAVGQNHGGDYGGGWRSGSWGGGGWSGGGGDFGGGGASGDW